MSRQAFIEYLMGLARLYREVGKAEKTRFLTEAVAITGKSRRTIQRYMGSDPADFGKRLVIKGRGRRRVYLADELLPHIRVLWKAMEMISSERMKEALPKWAPFYDDPGFTPEVRAKLLKMSRGTLERFLAGLRREREARRGLSTTTSGLRSLKMKVPINTLDFDVVRPGFMQGDTVAHCGQSTAGAYVSTLTLTDLWSGWTENRALPSKRAIEVRRAFVDVMKGLPFELVAVNTDSGSEFINNPMIEFLRTPMGGKPITFTRSRPYKKNDNAYVEQKNYTHVRQLFGYQRLEDTSVVEIMNEIYREYWNPLHNYFLPSQKLLEKTRVGARIAKRFDTPTTPADRLLKSEHLSEAQKEKLRLSYGALNPFTLKAQMEIKLQAFFHHLKHSAPGLKEAA